MKQKYYGPNFDELPEGLRDRIREAAHVVETETRGLGIVVSDKTESYRTDSTTLWKLLGDFREVFVYDFGGLHEVYFREDNKAYKLYFCGWHSEDEMEKVEKTLGLDVVKRPKHNQDEAEIRIDGVPLERLVGLGHQPNTAKEDPLKYQLSPSGPYVARK